MRAGTHYAESGHWVDVILGHIAFDGRIEQDDRLPFTSGLRFGQAMDSAERAMDEYADREDAVVVAVYAPTGDEVVAWLRDGDDWRRA